MSLHKHTTRKSLVLAAKQGIIHANRKFDCSDMVNTKRKNQAAKGISANAGGIPGEQPSANGPSPWQQQEKARAAGLAMSEQRITTIEDGMHDLKEMIRKQAEEIERMNKETEAWKKQQDEFQAFLINLGMGQQPPSDMRTCTRGKTPKQRGKFPWLGPRSRDRNLLTFHLIYPTWIGWRRMT
jgi:hypothetical protein